MDASSVYPLPSASCTSTRCQRRLNGTAVTTLHRRLDLLATEQARPVARGWPRSGTDRLEDECAVSGPSSVSCFPNPRQGDANCRDRAASLWRARPGLTPLTHFLGVLTQPGSGRCIGVNATASRRGRRCPAMSPIASWAGVAISWRRSLAPRPSLRLQREQDRRCRLGRRRKRYALL